jgi:hypothetical protein
LISKGLRGYFALEVPNVVQLFCFLQLFCCSSIGAAQFCVESASLAVFFRVKPVKGYRYLQIARSVRHGKTVRQEIIATLGRLDLLQESGQLDRLLRSGLRFARQVKVLDAHAAGQTEPGHVPKIVEEPGGMIS